MRSSSYGILALASALGGHACAPVDARDELREMDRLEEPAAPAPLTPEDQSTEPVPSDRIPEGYFDDVRFVPAVPTRVAPNTPASPGDSPDDEPTEDEPASIIEIELAPNTDDFVYASVDGLRKKVWFGGGPDHGTRLDVSDWFTAGTHTLRFVAVNTVGPTSYGVRVWVDGALALDERCPASRCGGEDAPTGILLDRSLTLTTPNRPAAQAVRITSATPGKIYIDDAFTGLATTGTSTPVSLELPPGEYTFGLGLSDDSPPVYTGSYLEKSVALSADAPLDLSFSGAAPLSPQERTSIVLVPVRNFVVDTFEERGVLQDADVEDLASLAVATRDEWLEPFSYGLVTWDLDLLPIVEDVPLHAAAHDAIPDAEAFLEEAGLTELRARYEIVVLYYDVFDADGNVLSGTVDRRNLDFEVSAWGGGGMIWFNTFWAGTFGDRTGPNPALLHEALHNYEGFNESRQHFYNGVDGLHGDGEHGYYSGSNGELDFAQYQRLYMRNQVAELSSMRRDVNVQAPPASADLWVGVFDTMRRGYFPLRADLP